MDRLVRRCASCTALLFFPDLVKMFSYFENDLIGGLLFLNKNMCDFKTLYYGEEGYVIVCSQCNHFQLAFYSTLFTFTAGDFQVFYSLVRKNLESHGFSHDHSRKNIYIPAPQEGCGVILTIGELEVLFELLETAEVNYKAERLLELFKPT